MLNYPLELNFKKLALAHQLSVTDASDNLVWYVKQKAFKLKEEVSVFGDREQNRLLYAIRADRLLDFSARYSIRVAEGSGYRADDDIGSIRRQGVRSLWKSRYEIERRGSVLFTVEEENPWTKVADALLCEIPIVGIFSGYMFHPRYLVTRAGDNSEIMRLEKQAAFLEGRFTVEKLGMIDDRDETLVLLSMMMMVLLERGRG